MTPRGYPNFNSYMNNFVLLYSRQSEKLIQCGLGNLLVLIDSEELHTLSSELLAITESNLNSPRGRFSKREVFM
jgi:hypothetical protein